MRPSLILVAFATLVAAQEHSVETRPTLVRGIGEATVQVRPDQTRLRVGVVSTAGSAERARERNATRIAAVIARLREILGQDVDIQTANYSLNNNYSQGYVVNNTLVVKVHDPANMGKVIDAVTKSGANVIGGLESSAAQDQAARSEALQQATAQALVNAKAMAAGLGLRFVRVVLAEPSTSSLPIPGNTRGEQREMRKATVATPIEAGTDDIRVQVVVTIEVVP